MRARKPHRACCIRLSFGLPENRNISRRSACLAAGVGTHPKNALRNMAMLDMAVLLAGTGLVCPADIDSSFPVISSTSFRTQTGEALHQISSDRSVRTAGPQTLHQTLIRTVRTSPARFVVFGPQHCGLHPGKPGMLLHNGAAVLALSPTVMPMLLLLPGS